MEGDIIFQNNTCQHVLTEIQTEFLKSLAWWMEGFGGLFIGFGGISINILAICIILKSELRFSFFYWLLICLEIFDSCFLLSCVLEAFRKHIGSIPIHNYVFAVFLFPFKSVVMLCSIYITIALSVERYNALVNPVSHQSLQRNRSRSVVEVNVQRHYKRIFKYLGPTILFSVLFYIPRYFEIEANVKMDGCFDDQINTTSNCSIEYSLKATDLRKNEAYVLWYINILNLIVTCVLPILSIIYLNFKVYFGLKRYMKRRPSMQMLQIPIDVNQRKVKQTKISADKIQQTVTLFGIIIVFCVCHTLRVIMNIEELIHSEDIKYSMIKGCNPWSFAFLVMVPISELLLQINCSVNFFVYCAFNKRFKEVTISYVMNAVECCKKSDHSSPVAVPYTSSHNGERIELNSDGI